MTVTLTEDEFGTLSDGTLIKRFTFTNDNNVTVRVITLGGFITDVLLPDKNGKIDDICLGYDDVRGYENDNMFFGAVCGRVVNVISGGKFELDGKEYNLARNYAGKHHCHGGVKGFNKVVWDANIKGTKLELKYISIDGEEGYPGEVTTTITYELTDLNELVLDFRATTTKATPVNLSNHAYFNLAGQGSPDINDHILTIKADRYTPVIDDIPTGEIADVSGTLFDFRNPVHLGDRLKIVNNGLGYGHNFCLGKVNSMKQCCAKLEHPASGRAIEVTTSEPGIQLYTGWNMTQCLLGKAGKCYVKYSSVCLETQHYPDSVNKSNFPSIILRPGETYNNFTVYKFTVNS